MFSEQERIALDGLRRQYFALVPPLLIQVPEGPALIDSPAQQYLLTRLLDESHWPQPEDGYRRGFWRLLVRKLEEGLAESQSDDDDDAEMDERFYELLSGLMVDSFPSGDMPNEPRQSHRTFIYDQPGPSRLALQQREATGRIENECHITLLEEQTVLQGGTTGLRTWTAALRLGHNLVRNHDILIPPSPNQTGYGQTQTAAQTVLELGAGTGFLSCLLAQLGYQVISTDLGDVQGGISPLERLRHNVALNDLTRQIQTLELDWMDSLKDPPDRGAWVELADSNPNTILAADVIYDPDLIPPLVSTLHILLQSEGDSLTPPPSRQAIIAATVRNSDTLDLFVTCCRASRLDVVDIDLPNVDPADPVFWDSGLDVSVPVRIMRITPQMQIP